MNCVGVKGFVEEESGGGPTANRGHGEYEVWCCAETGIRSGIMPHNTIKFPVSHRLSALPYFFIPFIK